MFRDDDPTRRARRPLRPPDDGSAARRLAWAVVGAILFVAVTHGLDLI
jgi:hypothetical protein